MYDILTVQQSQKADAAAIARGVKGIELMSAAGHAAANEIMACLEPQPTLVLCGPGQNGGDGFVVATLLHKAGWPVRVACTVGKKQITGDAALAAKQWEGAIEPLNSNLSVHNTALVIDAVFGTGFKGALDPELVILFDKIRTRKLPVVAIDLPSGIHADTGFVAAGTLRATLTVTFTRKKIAHLLQTSKVWCGRLHTAIIGVTDEDVAATAPTVFENHPALWLAALPLPSADDHKYNRGMARVYGGHNRPGAACLAAAAAQKIGAGVVAFSCGTEDLPHYRAYRASIMADAAATLDDIKSQLRDERVKAFVIGSGGDAGDRLREATLAALAFPHLGCVLDGDIFTVFKDKASELFPALSPRHVLTPHEGEFARLFGDSTADRLSRARQAARAAKAVIVLKGPDTIIAGPDGTAIIQPSAPATLATAGSGDVLAGLIGGLIAQGMPSFMAAAAAVWIHGKSASLHGLGLTAEDLIANVSQCLNQLFGIFTEKQLKF